MAEDRDAEAGVDAIAIAEARLERAEGSFIDRRHIAADGAAMELEVFVEARIVAGKNREIGRPEIAPCDGDDAEGLSADGARREGEERDLLAIGAARGRVGGARLTRAREIEEIGMRLFAKDRDAP